MQETKLFEEFIIKCCEMDEWDLRDFLKEKLIAAGFEISEDNYRSPRKGKYQVIHNMLAIRGSKPKICLVAHTDVCRDHTHGPHRKATPIIKEIENGSRTIRVIQDEHNRVQVGGDDRLGVAINTWIALNTGYDMGLLFTTDEEIGNQSADYADFPKLMDFELCVQVDRGNRSQQLVTNIGGVQLCSNEMAQKLLTIAEEMGVPRIPVRGLMTDVLALTENGKIKSAVNMTCGYHNSIGSSANEFILIDEAVDTLDYVNNIVKHFELETIEDLESNITTQVTQELITEISSIEIWN